MDYSKKGISRGFEGLTAGNYAILAALGYGIYYMATRKPAPAQGQMTPDQAFKQTMTPGAFQQAAVQGRQSIWRV